MTVAASGSISLTLDNLRNVFAASATFQSLLGVVNAAAAKAKTYWLETDDEHVEAEAALPRAIVAFSLGQFDNDRISTTGWGSMGPLEILIEVDTPSQYVDNLQDGNMWFTNSIGAMIDEIKTLVTSGQGYLNITSLCLDYAGRIDPERSNGNKYYAAGLTARFRGI